MNVVCQELCPKSINVPKMFVGPHRIQNDIPANLKKMAILLDQNGFVSSLEQVTGPAMPIVKELCVNAVQLPHANG